MGESLLSADWSNPKGHYEDVCFLELNKSILKDAKGSWRNPPSEKEILKLKAKYEPRIIDLIKTSEQNAKNAGFKSWGFKDPRTCLTLPLFVEHLTNPNFVVIYRNPKEIAESLNKRNSMSIPEGLKLCEEYNKRINKYLNIYA